MRKKIVLVSAFVLIALLTIVAFKLCAVSLDKKAQGIIRYKEAGEFCSAELSEKEVKSVLSVLNGKMMYSDIPACGFDYDHLITIDGVTFAMTVDSCCKVKNCDNGKFINTTEKEKGILRALFEMRGVTFLWG